MEYEDHKKLLFVYNADSGIRNAILDSAHKFLSPDTYDCNLCDITFGIFSENKKWKEFRESSELEMEFLHRDEYRKQYASKFGPKFTFPIVLFDDGRELSVLLGTDRINQLESAEELISALQQSLGSS